MKVSNYRSLCVETFKTLIDINPSFIKNIFKLRMTNRPTRQKCKLNLEITKSNQVRFGTKNLRYLGPKVSSSLPYNIKSSEILTIFKTLDKKLEWNSLLMKDMQKKTTKTIHFVNLVCNSNKELIISFITVSNSGY